MKHFLTSNAFIVFVVGTIWLGMELLFYNIAHDAQKAYEKNLLAQADFYYKDIDKTRNAYFKLGGVYVYEKALRENLEIKEFHKNRIESPKGTLIEINPSMMSHFLNKISKKDFLHYRLLSNKPLNPQNKADGFYEKALQKLESSKQKEPLFQIDEQSKYLYYIQPLYVEKGCLNCHNRQGVKEGDLQGGFALDMDASFAIDRMNSIWYNFFFASLLLTLFMLLMLFFLFNMSREKLRYLTQKIVLEKSLDVNVQKLNQLLKASKIGYWEWNIQTGEHLVDEQWLKMLGLTQEVLKHKETDWSERIHKEDAPRVQETIQNAIKFKSSYVVEFRMLHADGYYIWIQGSGGVTQKDANGEALKLSGTHQNITQRKLLEIEQQNSEAYLKTLFEKNPNIIIVSDEKNIIKANDAFFQFFSEYDSLETFINEHKCICDFFVHEEGDKFITNQHGVWMEEVLESSEPLVKICYKDKEYYFAVYAKKVKEHEKINIIVTFNNITETYGLKKRFEELSIVDELTKVYNRRYFNTLFLQETNRASRENHSFCLAILDIDNFKRYNDNYGHDAGDDVLVRFASEIKKIAQRSNEFFFRLGGEEFGLIYSNKTQDEALQYAQMICKSIEALDIVHEHNPPWNKFTASIGVAYILPDAEPNLKAIYKKADDALYRAKANGRNRVELL